MQKSLKPIKVWWPNLSCWGSRSIPRIQVTQRALSLSTPSQHIQPETSIACLTWHIITVEIFVYFVRVPQSALQPTAKSSQLPLQLSQPESLIKTRCFHLGQLWKKSLPETRPLPAKTDCGRVCHVWQSWHAHCTKKRLGVYPKCATGWSPLRQSGALKDLSVTRSVPVRRLSVRHRSEGWVVNKIPWRVRSSLTFFAEPFNLILV